MTRASRALSRTAADRLRTGILNVDVRLGGQLDLEGIARKLAVSCTPVCETLLLLKGLVQAVPRVAYFVASITRSDMSFSRYLVGCGPMQWKPLIQSETAVADDELRTFLQAEIDFHDFLMMHAPNRQLAGIMSGLKDLNRRERMLALKSCEIVQLTLVAHRRILDALREKDCELAGRMMAAHINGVRTRMLG